MFAVFCVDVVFFPLGEPPTPEFLVPMFRNTLFHLSSSFKRVMKVEQGVPKRRHINSDAGELSKRKNATINVL